MSIASGNKVEFQLSGKSAVSRKLTTNALLATSDADNYEDEHSSREMVSSVAGNRVLSLAPTAAVAAPLVIPLLPPKHMTEDDLAAKRIVDELHGSAGGDDSGGDRLVIAQQNEVKGKVPLLLASQDPQLVGIADETERFKFDISSRADDVDFRSDIYRNIPIEKFGEAMLRGMGWDGVSKEEKEAADKLYKQVTPRDDRLGLGAMPRPPDENTRGSKESKKKLKEEWKNKALDKLSKQRVREEDIVLVLDKLHANRRAVVVAVKGVPGLDKIRVCFESDGSLAEVGRLDVLLLGDDELASRPYSMTGYHIYKAKVDAERASNEASVLAAESSDKSDKRLRESGDNKMHSSKKSKHEDKDCDRDKEKHIGSSKDKYKDRGREASWLRNGIRVKIITKKFGDKYYLMKSSILDVYGLGLASVRLDDGKVIENVKQKYLETVLPAVGGICVVLRGDRPGQQAILLERKKELEQVVVQMQDDLDVYVLSADDVAATS